MHEVRQPGTGELDFSGPGLDETVIDVLFHQLQFRVDLRQPGGQFLRLR